ncbi:MAG: hypothetical protein LC632_09485, partial [Xanthomonadaceae bacterium]|nr:hypothetical protein [Xanthomonadaceae bacterium]
YRAVLAALAFDGTPVVAEPYLVVTPATVNFGATLTELQVTLTNAGGGTLVLDPPLQTSGGWLFGSSVEEDGEVIWTLQAVRDGLAEGAYSANIIFPSNANTVTINAFMEVSAAGGPDVGFLYVILIDPDTFDTVNETAVDLDANGEYLYRVPNVLPGEYIVLAGSDYDNDFFICRSGEACGLFRSPGQISLVEVDGQDVVGIDFSVGFRTTPRTQATGVVPQGYSRLSVPRNGDMPGEAGNAEAFAPAPLERDHRLR